MKKGLLIGTAVVALCAGLILASGFWQSATQSELPVAAVMPQSTVYYVEARDLRGLVKGVRGTDAWRDLQASGLFKTATEGDSATSFAGELTELSKRLDFTVDEDAVLNFLGDDAAIAVWTDDANAAHAVLVTRLDVAAIAKDLVVGETDWRALHREFVRRAKEAGSEITTEEYQGYEISIEKRDDNSTFVTLMEDLLVVGNTREAVVTAIDLRVVEGAGSLNELPAFSEELARLPAGTRLRDWVHLERLRGTKITVPGEEKPVEFTGALAAFAAPAVARAIDLPDDDLYQLGWTWSRSDDELFSDTASPSIGDVMPEGAIVRMEAQRLGQLASAWEASSMKTHLESSWAAEKIKEAIDGAADEALDNVIPGDDDVGGLFGEETFWQQFGWNLGRRTLSQTFGTDAALAMWRGETPQQPGVLLALRLETDGRVGEAALRSVIDSVGAAGDEMELRTFVHGERTVRVIEKLGSPFALTWVTVGDLLLIGSTDDVVKRALDRAAAHANDAERSAPSHGLPTDYRLLVTISVSEYLEFGKSALGGDAETAQIFSWMHDMMPYDEIAVGIYATDDLSQVDVRVRVNIDGERGSKITAPYLNVPRGAPRSFDVLPDGAIAVQASRMRIADAVAVYDTDGMAEGTAEVLQPIREGIAEFEKSLGVDLDAEILPALGDEIAFALLYDDRTEIPEMPPIPGLAFLVGIRDQAVISAFLEKLAEMGDDLLAESRGSPLIERDERDPILAYRLVDRPGESGVPFQPTVTFVGDFLVIALDDSTIDTLREVQAGNRTSHTASRLQTRVRAAGFPVEGSEVAQLDWGLLLDQIALYAPQIAPLLVDDSLVPAPEFPEDGDMEEWNRRMAGHQQAVAEEAAAKQADVIGMIDSLRFIDFMATVMDVTEGALESHSIIRFKD